MASNDSDTKATLEVSGESTLQEATKKAQKQMDQLLNVSLHIAVTGVPGAGKSSFINAIRGLSHNDEGAAKTGVTETTTEPTPYKHSNMPNVTFWDLPGIGSPKFKAKQYLKAVKFDMYDFFIIVTSVRFKENDMMLAREIRQMKKLFYFVRSKIDNDIREEETKMGFDREETLSLIREDCVKQLKAEIKNPKVFLITSKNINEFDFEKLVDTLRSDLPVYKQSALLQSVPITSVAMLKKKVEMFEKVAWAAATCSGVIAAAPVPGVSLTCDASILVAFFTWCYYSFGLDDKSPKKLSERVNKPLLEYLPKSELILALSTGSTARLMLSSLAGQSVVEYLCSLLPGVGSALAAGMSFAFTLKLLKTGLRELENASLMMLKMAELE